MFRHKFEIFIFFLLLLKVCNTKSLATTNQTQAQSHTQHLQSETSNAAVSSYFRQDPYGPNTYAFGYEVDDRNTNNMQFRDERRYLNGTIVGSYGYVRPDGRITLTRYLADKEHGYHTHTDIFQPGEVQKVAAARWPTFTSEVTKPATMSEMKPHVHDQQQQHNLTKEIIQAVKEKHGIDLTDKDLAKSGEPHHDPTIADIVNGDIPLSLLGDNKSSVVGFETVNKFIPDDFPIVPFELPTHLQHTAAHMEQSTLHLEESAKHSEQPAKHSEQHASHSEQSATHMKQPATHMEHHETVEAATDNKYDHAKQNNAEKTLPKDHLKTHDENRHENHNDHEATIKQNKAADQNDYTMQEPDISSVRHESSEHNSIVNPPKKLVDADNEKNANATWYRKVINEARKEFLQNLPSLE